MVYIFRLFVSNDSESLTVKVIEIINSLKHFLNSTRLSALIVKYNICFVTLLKQDISQPVFYGNVVYKLRIINGKSNFSDQFKKDNQAL